MEKIISKNSSAVNDARIKVEAAIKIERQIDKLDDAIKFLAADIGFLDIRVNVNNQGEIKYAELLGTRETFDIFKEILKAETIAHRNTLVEVYNNLKF